MNPQILKLKHWLQDKCLASGSGRLPLGTRAWVPALDFSFPNRDAWIDFPVSGCSLATSRGGIRQWEISFSLHTLLSVYHINKIKKNLKHWLPRWLTEWEPKAIPAQQPQACRASRLTSSTWCSFLGAGGSWLRHLGAWESCTVFNPGSSQGQASTRTGDQHTRVTLQ